MVALRYVTNLVLLGCDDLEWAETATEYFVRLRSAPLFPLLTAAERSDARCYVELREQTYFPLGSSAPPPEPHPKRDLETLVFIDPAGAFTLREESFRSIRPEPTLLHSDPLKTIEGPLPPFRVPLRLVRSREHVPPRLWVLRSPGGDAARALGEFARALPEQEHEQIEFAVVSGSGDVFLRTLQGSVLDLSLDLAFYELDHCEGVFVPVGYALSPRLRAARLGPLIDAETDSLRILSQPSRPPIGEQRDLSLGDGVRLHVLARRAFHPLSEWVNFVVERAEPFVDAWKHSQTFDFAQLIARHEASPDLISAVRMPPPAPPESPGQTSAPPPVATLPSTSRENGSGASTLAQPLRTTTPETPAGVIAEYARLEEAFLSSRDPIDAERRVLLYQQLGAVSRALGNRRDASLYAARVLWTRDTPGVPFDELAPLQQPADVVQDVNDAREHLLHFCCERAPSRSSLQSVTGLVHRFFDTMDLFSLWLTCSKLARDTGDNLGLAQWRDRILVRVRDDEDLRAGWPAVFRAWAFRFTSQELPILEQVREQVGSTSRKRSPVEAPLVLTAAYTSLILAKAYAYVGRTQQMEEQLLLGRAGLESADPVHQVLRAMFVERIEGAARTGRSYGPYSPHLEAIYFGLDRAARYKIDRLRSALLSLESIERIRPFESFKSHGSDPRVDEFASLRKSPEELAANFEVVLGRVSGGDEASRMRTLEGLSDFLARFNPSEAPSRILSLFSASRTLQTPHLRAKLQLRLLSCAAHLSSPQAFGAASRETMESLAQVTGNASLVNDLVEALPIFLRTGNGDMIRPFLERARDTSPLEEKMLALGALSRLDVQGDPKLLGEAIAHFEHADPLSRVRLAHVWSRSMAAFPSETRKELLSTLLRGFTSISDSYSTNSHFCLSVLEYAEAIAFAVALPGRNPSVELVDQDERALRRRIERDTAALSVTEDVRSQ